MLFRIDILLNFSRKLNINRQTLRKPSSNLVPERRKSFARLRSKDKKNDLRVSHAGHVLSCYLIIL